jgi:peptidoglycan/xylan/chitin deacetylase (PgdA/CDA1 family)
MKVKIPKLVKMFYPGRVWEGPKNGKTLYLTFDDGPIPGVTPWILEQLRKADAKATFFCIGDNIQKHPEVFDKVVAEGHAVGSHTFNHLNGWKTPTKEYILNAEAGQEILEERLKDTGRVLKGKKTFEKPLFRPPYGRIRSRQEQELKKRGFKIVMWDVLSLDYDQKLSGEACYQNVIDHAESGSIIVFHDSLKAERNLKTALPKVLEYYNKKGYSFESLAPDAANRSIKVKKLSFK